MDRDRYGQYAAGAYLDYQKRYASRLRESDRVIAEHVLGLAAERPDDRLTLVDLGCSTGNLLLHLKSLVPGLRLFGGDVYPAVVERCQGDPALSGITFEVMDLLDLPRGRAFDIVVVNAVFYLFGREDFEKAIANAAAATKPGGHFVTFDLFHAFEQDLEIVERSETHPEGLLLHFRPVSAVGGLFEKHGFTDVAYEPFRIPIDLPRASRPEDISSHTVATAGGERLIFRGALFTPWCHLRATKAR